MSSFRIRSMDAAQESFFDRQEHIEWWDQDVLDRARFLVVGAGAIGNETLKNLALIGARHIYICDFDTISRSNLSRTVLFTPQDVGASKAQVAARRIRDLCLAQDPDIHAFEGDIVWELGMGFYRRFDVVLGCLDNVETRLAVNRNARAVGVPWIDAGIRELSGGVAVYMPEGPCYACSATTARLEAARVRYSCDEFKRKSFEAGHVPTTQVAAALVSAVQVQEAVKLLCGQPTLAGKRFHFGGLLSDYFVLEQKRSPLCDAHEHVAAVHPSGLARENTLRELLAEAGAVSMDLSGRFRFIRTALCRGCGARVRVDQPAFGLYDADILCRDCGGVYPTGAALEAQAAGTEPLYALGLDTPELLDRTLSSLGLPYLDIARLVRADGSSVMWELSGDEGRLFEEGLA